MKDHKDNLLDELVKEHAKHGRRDDEAFLTELQQKIEASEKVVEMPKSKRNFNTRWAMGTGVAACLAIGFGAKYWMDSKNTELDIIAYHDASEQLNATEKSQSPLGFTAGSEEKGNEITRSEVVTEVERKGSYPAAATSPKSVPVPDVEVPSPSLTFAGEDSFGEGFASRDSKETVGGAEIALQKLPRAPSAVLDGDMLFRAKMSSKSKQNLTGRGYELSLQGFEIPRHPQVPSESNTERYGSIVDNPWKAPVDEKSSLSTFAVDVDTASYANVRRMINDRQSIPKDAVRIEEMLNYFDYQYAQPNEDHPFAVHIDACAAPWNSTNRLVRVGIQGKDIVREERPTTNLVFLLDVSGSMNSAKKLPLLKESMKYLLEELNADDTVSIVVYAGASGLALPATKMDDAGRLKVLDKLNSLSAGGSTAGGQGIKLAYKVAQENFVKGGVNRIVLATDGDFNVGVSDTDSLTKLVKEKAKQGTFISVLGFGSGNINDAMLESITNNGNGNYSYIDSIKEGRKVLLEDMMGTIVTIAKDVKVQIQMNPSKVKAYRLIGYANRILPPEAFLDKNVDAGEIGAGHTVTALYEIMPYDGKPFGENIDGSRYFEKEKSESNPAIKQSDELMFVKLAYKQPEDKQNDESTYFNVPFLDDLKDQPSDDLTFTSSVALLGMHLRESKFKGNGDLQMVRKLAEAGKGTDGKGQRAEFIKLVDKLVEKER